mmetsp:Transcript_202/g.515  ORF Transcript_202/g.515 Transcript_202/m.515 type:complete len:374 (+) Transcript_202:164-1285(+)|eukprot:CAMPEP_0197188688 /NCGR_PEP_ID=MMETSP1423-20130617/18288_1 /TAXON_ID=476441 /ORGANISM="Pseudo-nitzschia heimii, Strain UNC1101" /LENGTH=373 /DNA_ID=CAMNT_0042640593 /DNA_START=144 /DNA_END=1265 /DNA_ORIENTATION=+
MGENDQNDDGTPWESASNDRAFREQAEMQGTSGAPQTTGEPSTPAAASVRWDITDEGNGGGNNGANDLSFLTTEIVTESNSNDRRIGTRASCSHCLSKCSLSYFLHVWDIASTAIWTVFIGYHFYLYKEKEQSRSASMAFLLVLSVILTLLNTLRGILWIWASLPLLSTVCCCGCCFVDDGRDSGGTSTVSKLATNLTLLLGMVYGTVSVAAWFGPSSWLPWCDGLGPWCSNVLHSQTVIPITLTVASLIELIRWIFLRGKLSASMERTRSPDYFNDDVSASPSESSRYRPWWIGRRIGHRENDDLNNPLLDSARGQPSWTTPSWLPFGDRGSSSQNDNEVINGDEEDVESVLDSLGEDWASRAEEDPYWWTR